jgi:hypothetical protein
MSLVEVIVAIVLLTIISLVVVRLVIQTGASSSQSRYRVEATNVAEQEIESLQNLSNFGNIASGQQTLPSVTVAENGGTHNQVFTVSAIYTLQNDSSGTGTSLCSLANGTDVPPEIWNVLVNVSWGAGETVTEGTYLAPEAAGSIPATSGELAVPVTTPNSSGLPVPYTASPGVPISVVGIWNGSGSQPSVPSNEVIAATGGTGDTGCAVFQNLDPTTGFQYTVSVGTGGTTYTGGVTLQELPGIVNGSSATVGAFSEGPINLSYGTATLANPIEIAPGVNVPVNFVTQTSASCNAACAALAPSAADLAVTVQAVPQLTGANNTFAFDTAATPQQIGSMTLFPQTDYFCWAGDTPDSAPTYPIGVTAVYPGDAPTACDTTLSPSATLPVYPVVLNASYPLLSHPTATATEVLAPSHTIVLNPVLGVVSPGLSSSGLPLGEYQLGYELGASSNTLVSKWIWVTPLGVYSSATVFSGAPTGTPTSPGTAIAVAL